MFRVFSRYSHSAVRLPSSPEAAIQNEGVACSLQSSQVSFLESLRRVFVEYRLSGLGFTDLRTG